MTTVFWLNFWDSPFRFFLQATRHQRHVFFPLCRWFVAGTLELSVAGSALATCRWQVCFCLKYSLLACTFLQFRWYPLSLTCRWHFFGFCRWDLAGTLWQNLAGLSLAKKKPWHPSPPFFPVEKKQPFFMRNLFYFFFILRFSNFSPPPPKLKALKEEKLILP